jgi:hypothetical protein
MQVSDSTEIASGYPDALGPSLVADEPGISQENFLLAELLNMEFLLNQQI